MAWVVAINSTSNEKFLVKTLEDQQKIGVAFIRLISTLVVLGHCAICKYIYQNWMEGVLAIWLADVEVRGKGKDYLILLDPHAPLTCYWITWNRSPICSSLVTTLFYFLVTISHLAS